MSKPLKSEAQVATERFNLIAPLLSDGLDKGRRRDLMLEITEKSGKSERTIRRYVEAWKKGGFDRLKPEQGWTRPDSRLGGEFGQIVDAAVALRRESPSRSVADIIKILELEGAVPAGTVKRSTLQRHLAARGYAASQIKMYSKTGAAARRFKKEHRNQLWMSDIKYGPYVPDGKGKSRQIYLVVWIDDATRYIVSAKFYPNQDIDAIEDSLRLAIMAYGVPAKCYCDNGKVYRSKWLKEACAKLGIVLLHSRPYHPEGKGLVENFNRQMTKFISEAALKRPGDIGEYNELLKIWLAEYYHKRGHSGLSGLSPQTAFVTDTAPLRFVAAGKLKDAFLHRDARKVDKTGCVSFKGHLYEVGIAYVARKITICFDPSWTDELLVLAEGREFIAKKLVIGPNCGVTAELPGHMRITPPDTSRMLDALKKEHQKNRDTPEMATSFKDYWEGGETAAGNGGADV